MKIKRILSLVIAVILVLSLFSLTAFAEEDNVILNNAFYIEIPEDFENNSFYSDYYEFLAYDNDFDFKQINIALKENSGLITNMEEDYEAAKFAFNSFLENVTYFYLEDIVITKQEITEVNKCSVMLFEAFYNNLDEYESDEYIKAYLFANEQYIYFVSGIGSEKNPSWFDKTVKTFRMNGTLLAGDNQKNDIDFSGAIDYKKQLEDFEAEFDAFEDEDFLILFVFMAGIFVIPLLIVLVIAILFIIKYTNNKKILTQYEKTFGLLPGEMIMNNGYNNYSGNQYQNMQNQNMNSGFSGIPQQPTEPVNPNYQNQSGNFNNNQNL